MKEYSNNPFEYIDKSELTDEEILSVISEDKTVSLNFSNATKENQNRIIELVRSAIADSINVAKSSDNLLEVSQNAEDKIKKNVAEFCGVIKNGLIKPIFNIVSSFSLKANIDNIVIPVIIFLGNEEDLATVYQKLNQEGVKLTKYDVFAATWINYTITIKNDKDFIEYVIKKYQAAEEKSGLEIDGFDAESLRQKGELTVFEYAFAIGKAIVHECPKLFSGKNDDAKIDSIGFLLLSNLFGLAYSKMAGLAETLTKYKNIDYKVLKDDIVESAKIVQKALGDYITSPAKNNPSLVCHAELQLVSFIVVIFKLKFSISINEGIVPISGSGKIVKDLTSYLPKHYLWDILRGFWSGAGDSKLEEIVSAPATCRYVKDVDRTSFEIAVSDWLKGAYERQSQNQVSADAKLFLNYLLRSRVYDASKCEYDIEHCVPRKVLRDYLNIQEVPVSSVCNLTFIPTKENRAKAEKTYYQKQDTDASTYSLSQTELDKLLYPTRSELRFVESVKTITPENYRKFLKERAKYLTKMAMEALYPDKK